MATNHCGTSICAGGLCCYIPEFKQAGLHLVNDEAGVSAIWFCGTDGFDALSIFFGMDGLKSVFIFGAGAYDENPVTKQHVIDRIYLLYPQLLQEEKR